MQYGLFIIIGILLVIGAMIKVREGLQVSSLFTSIYYINLDKRPHKRFQIVAQLNPLKHLTSDIIRVSAIDGTRLRSMEPQIVSGQGVADLSNPSKKFGLSLTKGAVGCAMSHKMIWEDVVQNKKKLVLVVEDDAVILPDFRKKISSLISELPPQWDILYLGSSQYTIEKSISPHLARPSRIYGLFAYVINWQGAARLLNQCFPLHYQLDTELWTHFPTLKPLMAIPFIIAEKKGKSDIQIK